MKYTLSFIMLLGFSTALISQSIEQQLNDLGVLEEKLMFEWKDQAELDASTPYVVIDRYCKPKRTRKIDPVKVKRIDKIDEQLAQHLFGDKAANGVYRIVIDEGTNKDSFFKAISNPAYPSVCKNEEDKKAKKTCTAAYLDEQLIKAIGDQEAFGLAISIDYTGKIVELNINKGESTKALEKIFNSWKEKDFEWYPGVQREFFVNSIVYYNYPKKN